MIVTGFSISFLTTAKGHGVGSPLNRQMCKLQMLESCLFSSQCDSRQWYHLWSASCFCRKLQVWNFIAWKFKYPFFIPPSLPPQIKAFSDKNKSNMLFWSFALFKMLSQKRNTFVLVWNKILLLTRKRLQNEFTWHSKMSFKTI